jgi:DNA-binding IscR family transcriptional regulator
VLLGAELAFAHQNEPAYRQIAQSRPSDHAFREIVALRAMVRIAAAFLRGAEPLTATAVATQIGVPPRQVEEVLGVLASRGLVAIVEDLRGDRFVPARDLETITIKSVLDALKGTSGPVDVPAQGPVDEELDRLVARLDAELAASVSNKNLRELARAAGREVQRVEAVLEQGSEPRKA